MRYWRPKAFRVVTFRVTPVAPRGRSIGVSTLSNAVATELLKIICGLCGFRELDGANFIVGCEFDYTYQRPPHVGQKIPVDAPVIVSPLFQ